MSRAQLLAALASMFPVLLEPHGTARAGTRMGRRSGVNHRAVRAGVLFRRWQMTGVMPGRPELPGRAMPSWPAWTPREARRAARLRQALGDFTTAARRTARQAAAVAQELRAVSRSVRRPREAQQ